MKKIAAALAASTATVTSTAAMACGPTCHSAFESAECVALYGMFGAIFWVPLAAVTVVALYFLRRRFASRRGLVLAMMGAAPYSLLATLVMLDVALPFLERFFFAGSAMVLVSLIGGLGALNAGWVAGCERLGRG